MQDKKKVKALGAVGAALALFTGSAGYGAVANRMGLHDRGRIAPGMMADLVIFDPAKIQDQATFEKPLQFATGVDYLLINGQLSIDGGRATGAKAGRVLRHTH